MARLMTDGADCTCRAIFEIYKDKEHERIHLTKVVKAIQDLFDRPNDEILQLDINRIPSSYPEGKEWLSYTEFLDLCAFKFLDGDKNGVICETDFMGAMHGWTDSEIEDFLEDHGLYSISFIDYSMYLNRFI